MSATHSEKSNLGKHYIKGPYQTKNDLDTQKSLLMSSPPHSLPFTWKPRSYIRSITGDSWGANGML